MSRSIDNEKLEGIRSCIQHPPTPGFMFPPRLVADLVGRLDAAEKLLDALDTELVDHHMKPSTCDLYDAWYASKGQDTP